MSLASPSPELPEHSLVDDAEMPVVPPRAGLRRRHPGRVHVVGDLGLLRMAGLCVCFLVALLFGAAGLDRILPEPEISGVTDKLDWYERHRADVDTLVIGSSRVFRQIAPEIFDPAMEEMGLPSSSLNLGAPSMKLPEMEYLLRRLLRPGTTNPSRVFMAIESRGMLDLIKERNAGTSRVVYWHDFAATRFAIESFWTVPEASGRELTVAERSVQTLFHARMFLLDFFNVSEGVVAGERLVAGVDEGQRARIDAELDRHRGYAMLTVESPGLRRRRETFLEEQSTFEKRVERKRRLYRDPLSEPVDPGLVAMLAHMADIVRAVDAEPVFFVAPNPIVESSWMTRVAEQGRLGAVFVYDDPNRYPELYDASHYFDHDHLNGEGARLLTERLVSDYVEWKPSPDRAPEDPSP